MARPGQAPPPPGSAHERHVGRQSAHLSDPSGQARLVSYLPVVPKMCPGAVSSRELSGRSTGPGTIPRSRQRTLGNIRETTTRLIGVERRQRIEFEAEIGPMLPKCYLIQPNRWGNRVTLRGDSNWSLRSSGSVPSPTVRQQVWDRGWCGSRPCRSVRGPERACMAEGLWCGATSADPWRLTANRRPSRPATVRWDPRSAQHCWPEAASIGRQSSRCGAPVESMWRCHGNRFHPLDDSPSAVVAFVSSALVRREAGVKRCSLSGVPWSYAGCWMQ